MNTLAKLMTAAAVAGICAVPMATPSQAATWHGHRWHGGRTAAAVMGFGAGALAGAAATAAYGPGYDYGPGYGDYAYADPGYGAADPGYGAYAYEPPAYGASAYAYDPRGPKVSYPWAYGTVNNSDVNAHLCTLSPASTAYVPCLNQP